MKWNILVNKLSSSEEENKIERVENWELGSDILEAKDSPKFWEQG